ncbi:MAG TPA: hypothetical protein VKC60_08490, partial [Opitutaceae bacterium]|nr:hypothetical protein [Opitutaceae bacterium]
MSRFFWVVALLLLGGCVVAPSERSSDSTWVPTTGAVETPPAPPSQPPSPSPEMPPRPPQVVIVQAPPMGDREIVALYVDMLGREPSERELRRCHERAERYPFTPDELASELRASPEYRQLSPEIVIRRAYRDELNREPDSEGMRTYRRRMIENGWTPGQVRRAIAQGPERQTRSMDIAIERAYDDLLERRPDAAGRERYRRLLSQGGSEQQMRDQIRQSVEYRVNLPDAKTTRAYREVLGRDPDASGLESYRRKIVDRGWTVEDVKNDLRKS